MESGSRIIANSGILSRKLYQEMDLADMLYRGLSEFKEPQLFLLVSFSQLF